VVARSVERAAEIDEAVEEAIDEAGGLPADQTSAGPDASAGSSSDATINDDGDDAAGVPVAEENEVDPDEES
jgi:hypothetical protein